MRAQSLVRVAALFFLFAVVPVAWSQQLSSIVGVVRVLRGAFPEPVIVSLQVHGATVGTCYTDAEGRFAFNALAANLYHVVINDDHYMPVDSIVPTRPDIQPLTILQLTLEPRRTTDSRSASGPYVVSRSDFDKVPQKAVKEFNQAIKLEHEGKAKEAIDHYRKALEKAPKFAIAHNNLGSLYVGQSDFAAAQKELAESLRLAPQDSKAYFNMANLMLLTGKLQEAEHYLQEGFRKQPDSAFGFFVQGSVLERSGKYADAERALRRALELDPTMPRPHLELVNLYLREHRSPDAISELQAFLQVAPADPLAPKAREVLGKLETSKPAPHK